MVDDFFLGLERQSRAFSTRSTKGHVVGFAVKVTGRDESQGCNEVQAHRGEASCRSLVGLAGYTHAMHVCFDAMP